MMSKTCGIVCEQAEHQPAVIISHVPRAELLMSWKFTISPVSQDWSWKLDTVSPTQS